MTATIKIFQNLFDEEFEYIKVYYKRSINDNQITYLIDSSMIYFIEISEMFLEKQ